MSRYQALRAMRCDRLTSAVIALLNWVQGVEDGEIRFMHITIEYDRGQP